MGKELAKEVRAFDVWKRGDENSLVRYRCFEDMRTGQFCVQSADFYQSPVTEERISQLEKQFIELILEEHPFSRSGSFGTIEEAIADHEASFR
jgi:hypothetical protein